jgi:HEAT repeat protein
MQVDFMTGAEKNRRVQSLDVLARSVLLVICVVAAAAGAAPSGVAQSGDQLTPIQREIERQRQRLSSSDIEERRDALMRLGNLKRPDASRVAVASLNDPAVQVRVAAAHAVVFLPPAEAAGLLLPLLQDRAEFIRREAAYALGETRSRTAVARLTEALAGDKEASVRGAAAVALGQIGDETAVNALSQALSGMKKKKAASADEFLIRSAAHSLGQIRSRAGLPALIAALSDEQNPLDVRREAAAALGLIGDPSAAPSLRAVLDSSDPYLAEAAREALRRLAAARN